MFYLIYLDCNHQHLLHEADVSIPGTRGVTRRALPLACLRGDGVQATLSWATHSEIMRNCRTETQSSSGQNSTLMSTIQWDSNTHCTHICYSHTPHLHTTHTHYSQAHTTHTNTHYSLTHTALTYCNPHPHIHRGGIYFIPISVNVDYQVIITAWIN